MIERRAPAKARAELPSEAATRFAEMGLILWRFDTHGQVTAEPETDGVIGLWSCANAIVTELTEAVEQWNTQEVPQPLALCDGCWALPIPEIVRRKRTGYTVAIALGEALFESELFRTICRSVHIDEVSARYALKPVAGFVETEIPRLHATLVWNADDQRAIEKETGAIDGFSEQLTDAYETINALYTIGRSMSEIEHPANFIREMIERLFETMSFGWVLCRIVDDKKLTNPIRGKHFVTGAHGLSPDDFNAVAVLIEEACIDAGRDGNAVLLHPSKAIPECLGPQLVVQPIRREGTLWGLIAAGSKAGPDPQVSSYETLLIEAAGGYLTAFLDNVALYADQQATFLGTIRAMTAAIDAKDRYTRGHSDRVAYMSHLLAKAAGLRVETCERITLAAVVHDVGKIGVPESVLCKPGKLTDEEFGLIKLHPGIGHHILKDIPSLHDLLPGVLHHHERWDGNGYPHGLAGDQIPFMARIIGLADTFDAMSSTRAYRPAMPRQKVLSEIDRCAGSQFDPDLTPIFLALDYSGYDELVAKHAAEEPITTKAA